MKQRGAATTRLVAGADISGKRDPGIFVIRLRGFDPTCKRWLGAGKFK
jgi:hypothetical protein